ncbi:MAG TPA: hypothetical protein VNU70_08985, partial [Puia sp.]|nr:hypothetical protein [Puia sp.]
MTKIKFAPLVLALLCSLSLAAQPPATSAAIARLQNDIPRLLDSSDVPGLSIALIRNGRLVYTGAFGVTN